MQIAAQLGRLPELAMPELTSVLPYLLNPLRDEWCVLDLPHQPFEEVMNQLIKAQQRLGGVQRLVGLEKRIVERGELVEQVAKLALDWRKQIGLTGRELAISAWGNVEVKKFALKVKRVLKEQGWACRVIVPKEGQVVSNAQVVGERLAALSLEKPARGVEIVMFEFGGTWQIGVTVTAADIDFYSKRDFGIPAPDPVSGMLPPKLAQAMVNLAAGIEKVHVHDPFCGNGRIVLEAALMGLEATGSDVEEEKVAAARKNLHWLGEQTGQTYSDKQFWVADAREPEKVVQFGQPFVLVGEPYLGPPLREPLQDSELWLQPVLPLYQTYFKNWAEYKPECHLLVIPRVKTSKGELAVFDQLVDTFNRFGYSTEVVACYDRPDSIVRRDIVRIKNH